MASAVADAVADAPACCPRVPIGSLSASEFRTRFMLPNLPVLLTGATEGWRAATEWVTPAGLKLRAE